MLSKYSVKKPYTVVVAIIIILILGVVSYTKMSIDLIPSINLPYAIVSTSYKGATPEQVEMAVTSPLEQSLASINNIKKIQSVSSENSSTIILEFNDDTNMDSAMIEMRENLDLVTSYFPDEVGSPIILKLNPDMMPIISMSVAVEGMTNSQAGQYINDKIIPEIDSIEGIASVSATGIIEDMVDVTLSQAKIDALNTDVANFYRNEAESKMREEVQKQLESQVYTTFKQQKNEMIAQGIPEDIAEQTLAPLRSQAYGKANSQVDKIVAEQMEEFEVPAVEITKQMISSLLTAQNFSMPSGSVTDESGESHLVRVGDKFANVQNIKDLKLMDIPDYGEVFIDTVCDITVYDNSNTSYSKVNGNYAVVLSLQKQPNYSTADVSQNVKDRIELIASEKNDVSFATLMDQGEYVEIMINAIIKNLLFGGLLAIAILYIFLRKIRPTIIVGASIVISVIAAFVLMYFCGVSLNLISMGGLALGVGMLVDNSIVVIENIFRKRAEGMDSRTAAIEGAKQVSGAIFSSTLTTVIVFVPILFTTGITKQLFSDMGLTITFSLLSSLVVALTLVPAAASGMMKNNFVIKKTFIDKISVGYSKFLDKTLKFKWATIIITIVLLFASIAAALSSGTILFPSMDSGTITVSIEMPEEYTNEQRFEALDKVSTTLTSIQDIQTVGIIDNGKTNDTGMMGMMTGSGTTIYVLLKEERVNTTDQIVEQIREKSSDFDFELSAQGSNTDLTSLSGGQIVVNVYGRELDNLRQSALSVAEAIKGIEGTVEVSDGLGKATSEVRIIVDKNKAIAKGFTVAQAYQAVNEALKSGNALTKFTENEIEYNLYVKDERDSKITDQTILDIKLKNSANEDIPLSEIATVEKADGFSSINRSSQERYISVTGSIKSDYDVGSINAQIDEKLASLELASGCRYEIEGESLSIKNTFKDLALMLILAIVFIYLVMVAQFQSLLSPFIVMFTIPLAFTGGFLALYFAQIPISVVTLIGLVVLVGIVVNNGIVFVDYANQQKALGKSTREALLISAHDRLRPILMTALTTIIALLAMAFDTSTGSEMLKPMAITTIGGLVYSTILTLFLVPAMYEIFHSDKREQKKKSKEGIVEV